MRRILVAAAMLMLVLAVSSCNQPAQPTAVPPRETAPGGPPGTVAPGDLKSLYTAVVDQLLPEMGAPNLVDREKPQQELERMCFQVGRPGAEAERAALCEVMVSRLSPHTAKPARVWLLRQLERISGEESVGGVAGVLGDQDEEIRDLARRVLQNNPAPSATAALRAELERAHEPAWRAALVNALAARRDAAVFNDLVRLARDEDQSVARAAVAGLGDLGGAEACSVLHALWRDKQGRVAIPAVAALIRATERLAESGERDEAAKTFRELYMTTSLPPEYRLAALRGLTVTDFKTALPPLLDVIRGNRDVEMQLDAVRLLGAVSGQTVTDLLKAELFKTPPGVQVVVIDVLAQRGDGSVRRVLYTALGSDSEDVRMAALGAFAQLGEAGDVLPLAAIAAGSEGPERDAARRALARLHGEDADSVIEVSLRVPSGPGAVARPAEDSLLRAELVRALAERNCKSGIPVLLENAAEPSVPVRQAVYAALGKLGGEPELAPMLELLVKETDAAAREAAENGVVALAQRSDDKQRRVEPVLASLGGAGGTAKASLIGVLGRLQGPAALAAIRVALKDPDSQVADAAVRAISDWEETGVLDDLLAIARDDAQEPHRVLALRGYVRLLRLPSDRPAEKNLALLKEAMSLASRDDEKKLVLSALGGVIHADALALAQSYTRQESLRDEAATAVAAIATGLAAEQRDLARTAVDEVLALPLSDAARKRAEEARDAIKRMAGFITTWVYAGPYTLEGKGYEDVFKHAFEPETAAAGVTWQRLATTDKNQPWMYDLTKIGKAENCCVYAKTTIWSEVERSARLELGSDDGVKVWLNGSEVDNSPGVRSLDVGQDKVDITLKKGANPLLFKIIQAGGGWGFCCEVKGRDGSPIEGLKFQAE